MIKPGKTPLMRSLKLEKALGIEEIYLKLEGANPFGNKYDRISLSVGRLILFSA